MNDEDIEEIVADHREMINGMKESERKNLPLSAKCGKLQGKHEKNNK